MKKQKFKVDKHILTPKHLKLGEREKELPKILKTDSAIKELDVKTGDIIKTIRKSPTAGESIFYRVVSDV